MPSSSYFSSSPVAKSASALPSFSRSVGMIILLLLMGIHESISFATAFSSHPHHNWRRHGMAVKLMSRPSHNGRRTPLYATTNSDTPDNEANASSSTSKVYFDIAIPTPAEEIPLGRLTFTLTPPTHPHYLPLHISNLISLASSSRQAIDPKATYKGCSFQYSPATIDDGSFRYRWGHVCEGYGRNGIQVTLASGERTGWDEPFTDSERLKECSHTCFGGVYYGWRYDEIVNLLNKEEGQEAAAVLLTVPIRGPGAGTSKFSIVRVSESPREWGERLLLNSAVVGYLDCGADGTFGDEVAESDKRDDDGVVPTGLEVLRAMVRQRMGPPKIVNCGVL